MAGRLLTHLAIANLSKFYDGPHPAVDAFDLEIANREFIVIVGPSGCGKSTLLRAIAGLEELTTGEIVLDGRRIDHVPPNERDIAMVFQGYALYPHMTVRQNLSYALKLRKVPAPEISERVAEVASLLSLDGLLDRRPKALSGGQRQRVALGRAIIRDPKLFLMDEPLSSLDAKLRVQMRAEIMKIHRRLGATTLYVTHDQTEAMTMGDRIVVMSDGRIQQVGTPATLYDSPRNLFVADFLGSPAMNQIAALLAETSEGYTLSNERFSFALPAEVGRRLDAQGVRGREVVVGIRPEHLSPHEGGPLSGTIDSVVPLGPNQLVDLDVDTAHISVLVDHGFAGTRGEHLSVALDEQQLLLFDAASGDNLLPESCDD